MAREFKNRRINNRLSGRVSHVHPKDEEEMLPDTLRAHLIKYHGWTLAMLRKGRADGEEGVQYMQGWHHNDHQPMAGQK